MMESEAAQHRDDDAVPITMYEVVPYSDARWASAGRTVTRWYPRAVAWELFLSLADFFGVDVPRRRDAPNPDRLKVYAD